MKYKIGDRVRVRENLDIDKMYDCWAITNEMTSFAGEVVTIAIVYPDWYNIIEDNGRNPYCDEMFEDLVEYTYEDLCNSPVGTKITFENEMILIKEQDRYSNLGFLRFEHDLEGFKDNTIRCNTIGNFGKIIKIEEPSYTTVYEAKPDVLDEVEKEYLGNVIKPFKDRVTGIEKESSIYSKEFITVYFDDDDAFTLPCFYAGAMYKGMELDKEYSKEDLKL